MVTTHKSTAAPTSRDAFEADEMLALARIDMEKGNLSDALLKLKQVVAAESAPADAFSMCARLYAQLSLWDRAQKMYERYLELNPQALTETFQLGMVHFDAGRATDALKIWDNLLKNNATYPPALFYRALILVQQEQTASARQTLDALIKSAPTDNLYFGRAKELLQSLDTRPQSSGSAAATDVRGAMPKDAYKTEH